MKILIVGLNFHPELTGIGKYTGEMAAYLAEQGHEVRAVTGPPYYPWWKVQRGYRWWGYRREEWRGVKLWRCPLWVPSQPSGMKRILHHVSFALSSLPALAAQLFWRPRVVVCIAPSLLSAPGALLTARLCGSAAWLHIQDFEVDAATNLGMLTSGNGLRGLASRAERLLLRLFDRVSTISERMTARLREKGVPEQRIRLFPNWVDTEAVCPLPDPPESLRAEFGMPAGKVIVLYSGSMGSKQGLEVLVDAAVSVLPEKSIHFVLCGQGSARAELEELASGLPNMRFLPLQPTESLNRLLNAADIHVLPQRAGAADLVMPSKLVGMLASGRPVVALADPGTGVGTVVGQAGLLVPPGDAVSLGGALLLLAAHPEMRAGLGAKGRQYACDHWGAGEVLGRFQADLSELARGRASVPGSEPASEMP